MDLIHADRQRVELGAVDFLKFDGAISLETDIEKNDWEVEIPEADFGKYQLTLGDYLYFPGTEWGGRLEKFVHVSEKGIVRLGGVTWRGMLTRQVLSPPSGESHLVMAAGSLRSLLVTLAARFGSLYAVESGAEGGEGLLCGEQRFRYQNVLEAMNALAEGFGRRISLRYDPESRRVRMSARTTVDRSGEIEFSGDYDLGYTSTRADPAFNHVIALGRGEQEQRVVRHLYLLPDGSVTDDPSAEGVATGEDIRETVYDYPNYDYESQLISGAKKKLLKYGVQDVIELDFRTADIDLPLGDRVGIRDRLTGMAGTRTITEKLFTVSSDGTTLRYSVK